MKRQKILALIVALSLVVSITSCSSEKESSKDSSKDKKTEDVENETDDEDEVEETTTESLSECEANGHTWQDATCTEPKVCTVCGETEGEALGHTLGEANYQSGPVCEICGEVVGDPLPADLEVNGIACDAQLGVAYDVPTECSTDKSYETVGSWVVSDYRTYESDDEHEAIDGYEWQEITVTVHYTDDNAWNYGVMYHALGIDYYQSEDINYEHDIYTVNFNGVDYDQCIREFDVVDGGWIADYDLQIIFTFRARVPVGYDGNVFAVVNSSYQEKFENGSATTYDALNDNALVYRLG